MILVFDRVVQLPAELADEVDAHRVHGRHADDDVLRRQPAERLVRQVGIRNAFEQQPRLGSCKHEHAARTGQLGELHRAIARHVLLQVIVIQPLQGAR